MLVGGFDVVGLAGGDGGGDMSGSCWDCGDFGFERDVIDRVQKKLEWTYHLSCGETMVVWLMDVRSGYLVVVMMFSFRNYSLSDCAWKPYASTF